jgi:hypothetical protein
MRALAYAGREASGEFVRLKLKPDTDASALVGQDVMVQAGRLGEFRGKAVSRSDGHLIIRPSVRNRIDAGAIPEEGIVETDTAKTDGSLGQAEVCGRCRPIRSLGQSRTWRVHRQPRSRSSTGARSRSSSSIRTSTMTRRRR